MTPCCPFCERRFLFYQHLVDHLVAGHRAEDTGLGRPRGNDWWRADEAVTCWCGTVLGVLAHGHRPMSQFAEHLQAHGGAVAHLLALKMGVP